MTPRPDDQARAELKRLAAQAKEHREREHERIEAEFWQAIDALRGSYHGAQQDIADALDVRYNQVLRQTKRYRSADTDARPTER